MIFNLRTATLFAIATATAATLATAAPATADPRLAQALANFQDADANQDKMLDLDEFTRFIDLNADHGLGRAGMIRRFGLHSRAFGRVDANGDGAVTPAEIASMAAPRTVRAPTISKSQRAQVQSNFQQADVNKDGQLDADEFANFININAEHNLGRAELVRRFAMHSFAFGRADANGDGVVTPKEIVAIAQRW